MAVKETGRLLADRYRVVKPLGSGGMATVFLAEDERLGRKVAVKRLHAHSPDDMARRFQREAKLGASLNHPNLVSVFDTVTDGESVLIVMEYVEGETLADLVRRGPVERGRAFEVLRGAAAALDEAHGQGVVHRDVKPANVLLGERGDVKLADLGIGTATEASQHTQITREGAVLGTPSYMAPEQLEGGTSTPASDIYALAAVAFEVLSGRKARPGQTPLEIAHKVAAEPPPDVRDVRPEASAGLADALMRGMAKEPADRPKSAGELIEELHAALSRAPDRSPTPTRTAVPTALTAPLRSERKPPPRPPARPAPPAAQRGRPRIPAWVPAAAVLVLVAAAIFAIASSGGDGGSDGASAPDEPRSEQREPAQGQEEQAPAEEGQPPASQDEQGGGAGEEPAPSGEGGDFAAGGPEDAGLGSRLSDEGFSTMQQGDFEAAVPKLREAVKAFPSGSDPAADIQYAYALFNLGKALNRSGEPGEAIPYLEARLKNPDQRSTVQAELDRARSAAEGD